MPDILKADLINSLPQPLTVRLLGEKEPMWELHDIDVETGLLRINVCGKLQGMHISDIGDFTDMDGVTHDPDSFYCEGGQTP